MRTRNTTLAAKTLLRACLWVCTERVGNVQCPGERGHGRLHTTEANLGTSGVQFSHKTPISNYS